MELLPIFGQRKWSDVSGGSDTIEAKPGCVSLRHAVRFTDESSSRTPPAASIVSDVSGVFIFL